SGREKLMKQSVQVSILGQQFNLRSDAPPEQVHKVARFVEDQISLVTRSGRTVDSLQAAILALLNVSAAHLEGNPASSAPGGADESRRLSRLIEKIEAALG
ncbi:MAG: cell division protein ZapA, partial [Desulfuromonadales bacterium]